MLIRTCFPSLNSTNLGFLDKGEIRVSKCLTPPTRVPSLSVRTMAKKNPGNHSSGGSGDPFIPEGDGYKGNNSSNGNNSNESASYNSDNIILDWREVRASLFRQEQTENTETYSVAHKMSNDVDRLKWAHPISIPETGCVLIATEKLDGVHTFERSVVLLLRSGTTHPHEGPFGVVFNRPLSKKMKHIRPANPFSDCTVHYGGPLEARIFLLNAKQNSQKLLGYEEVIPGLCFGSKNNLDEASELVKNGLVKTEDFRFFVGYAGWQVDQLQEEIESNYWHVAACSSNMITQCSNSSKGLWCEILQLMGGHYTQLSRKSKKDV